MSGDSPVQESGPPLLTFNGLRERITSLTVAEWLENNPHPFLVVALARAKDPVMPELEQTLDRFKPSHPGRQTAPFSVDQEKDRQIFVTELRVQDASSDQPGFVVGRGADSDLVIPVATISSEHCRFVPPGAPGEPWRCVDLGTKNGTFIGEQRMIPGVSLDLTSATPIDLAGSVAVWFVPTDDMWELLHDGAWLRSLFGHSV